MADLRLHGPLALLRPLHGYGLGVATDAIVTLPTGDDGDFPGEEGAVFEGRVIASLRTARFAAAVNVRPRLRSER